jgi:hypothetical protein
MIYQYGKRTCARQSERNVSYAPDNLEERVPELQISVGAFVEF